MAARSRSTGQSRMLGAHVFKSKQEAESKLDMVPGPLISKPAPNNGFPPARLHQLGLSKQLRFKCSNA